MLIVVERRETFHYYYPMGVHPPGDLTVTDVEPAFKQSCDVSVPELMWRDMEVKRTYHFRVPCGLAQIGGVIDRSAAHHVPQI